MGKIATLNGPEIKVGFRLTFSGSGLKSRPVYIFGGPSLNDCDPLIGSSTKL